MAILRVVVLSLLAVLPCFWQARIQAGDLSSHLYNAWLAAFIEQHQPAGLQVVSQHSNVLFDELLSLLMPVCGAAWTGRCAVALVVLVFLWGAFRFAAAQAGRSPWNLFPVLLVLAYGWSFQMGLLNFYLSLGLCFWALSLALKLTWRELLAGTVLFAVAWRAHGLPVAWSLGAIAYAVVSRRLPARQLARFAALPGLAIACLSIWLRTHYQTQWSFEQLSGATGADQAWIFDLKYFLPFAGLLFVWVILLTAWLRQAKFTSVLRGSLPAQLALITAFAIAVMPTGILLPGFSHGLVFIAERMSLAVAVCLCAWLAAVRPTRAHYVVPAGVAVVFFAMLYGDAAALNRLETQVTDAVSRLPRNSRVVAAIEIPGSRIPAALHLVDRACLGWCFSYANYEPSTAQFRVRATGPNRYVASDYNDAYAMQMGTYVARPADLPLYQVVIRSGTVEALAMQPGERMTLSRIPLF